MFDQQRRSKSKEDDDWIKGPIGLELIDWSKLVYSLKAEASVGLER